MLSGVVGFRARAVHSTTLSSTGSSATPKVISAWNDMLELLRLLNARGLVFSTSVERQWTLLIKKSHGVICRKRGCSYSLPSLAKYYPS